MMSELIYLNDDFESVVDRILLDDELQGLGLSKRKVSKTLKSFQGDEIACSVFYKKYALRDENEKIIEFTLEEAKERWAQSISEVEKKFKNSKDKKYFKELYEYFLPAGRQMFALGNDYIKKSTLTNCYVTKIEEDSIEGIFDAAKHIAKTYSYGGGIGFCIGELRPEDSKVSNSAKFSTGAVSFMELFSLVTGLIGQFGRRGALMITCPVSHPDIENFIEAKHFDKDKVKHANISIKLTDEFMNAVINDEPFNLQFTTKHETIEKMVNAKDLWNKIVKSARDSAEPGLLFWDRAVQMSPSDIYPSMQIHSTNPCVTGDTLVYVADGRGNVSIKELAEKNIDVPVFCLDNQGKIKIRYMRRPRITGYKQGIYKVTLDDGSSIRATNNHKFRLLNGEYKSVDKLKVGESLKIVSKFKNNIKNKYNKKSKKEYNWISNGSFSVKSEHKYIAEFLNNDDEIPDGYVVHHKDFNSINNNPNNLKIMTTEQHNLLHSENMIGDKNPMRRAKKEWSKEKWECYSKNMSKAISGAKNGKYNGVSNEELKKHALLLTNKLGYRFSTKDWRKYAKRNNITEQFSKWRNDHLGGIVGLSKWAANKCELKNIDLNPRTQKHYLNLLEQGYNCKIKNGSVYVIKKCEICGKEFDVHHSCRESGICSQKCHSQYMSKRSRNDNDIKQRAILTMKKTYRLKKEKNAKKQVKIFVDLKSRFSRDPLKKEWEAECKKNDIPFRVGKSSYFKNFTELKDEAGNYNHKVVSVEFYGYEDVYNGTVDEFHNFLVGGFKSKTPTGKDKYYYIVNSQCGEQMLEAGSACCLGSLLLHKFVENPFTDKAEFNYELFSQMVRRGVRHLDNIVELNIGKHALEEQEDSAKAGRRIGLGITGLADMYATLGIKYDSEEAIKLADTISEIKKVTEYDASIELAVERGSFPLFDPSIHFERGFCATLPEETKNKAKMLGLRNVALSTIAPSGSLSIIAQCSSGIEPIFALSYIRTIKLGKNKKKEFKVFHQGLPRFYNITKQKEKIIPDYWVVAHEIDYKHRIRLQGVLQSHIDASISSTINVPEDTDCETVSQIYMDAWKEGLKGITVYREGSREGILVTNEFAKEAGDPMMDSITYCVKAEGGDKFYIIISYKDNDIRRPYQVFVMNYKRANTDSFVKISNALIRMLSDNGVDQKRIQKYIDRSSNSLVKITRFLSLSMKTDNLENALIVLNENAYVGTLASKLLNILQKSSDARKFACPKCGRFNIKSEEGCISCLDCSWTACG
jgi:ribonucleotide reductase alpha subunit